MANMLPKSLKDMRRRSVEYAFGAMGNSDRTTDPEWEVHNANYKKTIGDLNNCTYYTPAEHVRLLNSAKIGWKTSESRNHFHDVDHLTFIPRLSLYIP